MLKRLEVFFFRDLEKLRNYEKYPDFTNRTHYPAVPRLFEAFSHKWDFFNFGHTLMMFKVQGLAVYSTLSRAIAEFNVLRASGFSLISTDY